MTIRRIRIASCVPVATALLLANTALAAQPGQSTRPTPVASSITTQRTLRDVETRLAGNDSLGALAALDSALARDRKNGALWHRYGSIAWGMSKTEPGPVMRPEMIRLRMRADSAMRYATAFAPDSAQYWLDLGLYALETNIVFARQSARGNFEDGIRVARTRGLDTLAAAMIDHVAMFDWREYDNVAHRAVEKSADDVPGTATPAPRAASGFVSQVRGDGAAVVAQAKAAPDQVFRDDYAAFYRDRLSLVTPLTGDANYAKAMDGFREALALDPANARVRRHVYMALADHRSWTELRAESARALQADRADVDGWLSRGIAEAALERYDSAGVAFDQALQLMSAPQRKAFTNIKRLLAPSKMNDTAHFADSLHWDSLSVAERARQEALFWNLADPRPTTRVNEAMVEFFARVAYADLRFGSEEYRVRGADSPRGDTWVRYGPPDAHYSVPRTGLTDIIWLYDRRKLAFVFQMRPTFGTANLPPDDALSVDSMRAMRAHGWDNMPLVRRTWPMRVRVARFRASADSMDAVVTSTVPVRSLLADAELQGPLPISVQLDVHDARARIVGRETRRVEVARDSLPVGINGAWVRRVGRGTNVVRVDAEQVDVQRSATGIADATVDTTSGFGISDLLLGTSPRRVGNADPVRWRDVSIAPTTGVFPWSQSVGVVWEVYDLVPVDGNVRYTVNLHLSRTFAGTLKGFIAKVAAYTKNVIERDGSGTGSVSVRYEQKRPAAAIVADYVSVNLSGSVPGTYKLIIEIEDLSTGKTVRRQVAFDLAPN